MIAEKPSVARDIARVLGAGTRGDGFLHGNGYVVTWAIGHLAALAQPHEIRPEWKTWRRDLLPMLPEAWPLIVYDKTKDQFETIRKILTSAKVSRVICATDAGREGELIFRYIYEAAGSSKPVERLWISSLTPDAIRRGFEKAKPGAQYDGLADAARGRSRADWLVGMNLSRAYALTYGGDLSVGRVQTPTLAMVVERELAIRKFVPEDYIEVVATFESYKGTWVRDVADVPKSARLAPDGVEAKQIVERAKAAGTAVIESVQAETQKMAPPFFYDLTELQRHANRLFGFSAQKTLDIAQALYEQHKLISYPRTDSRYLSKDIAATLGKVTEMIAAPYREHIAPGTGVKELGKRFVDDAKVSDHHAIIPTATSADRARLSAEEAKIYDLICRRLLSAWHDDHVWSITNVITAIVSDKYHSQGKAIQQEGWKVLDIKVASKKGEPEEQALPGGLAPGQVQKVLDAEIVKKKTRAPKRLTEASLLTAMETAGKTLDEKELSDAMKDSGLGTPATRASIIEVLLKREYIIRSGKNLEATEKGISLIEVVHPEVKSPAMTGQWEAYLKRIERGEAQLQPFMEGIERYVTEVVGKVAQTAAAPVATRVATAAAPVMADPVMAPVSGDINEILHKCFGFDSFRANQEEVCRTVIEGRDALLVMPTGAGKSLCYQLPGIARGGTTLVISPLIALMEDQYAKLRAQGFAVECIHSGRDRAASRQACIDYLNGKLQFLFIAPERLRVAGFPEMLAKRKPALVAIDEAHCISQWGHDFRPDYRLLGGYLPTLRPAPVIALTATATELVQKDILDQLGLEGPASFIHGFRRENIAIEVVETSPSQRPDLARELLLDDDHRPAIIYAPSRKLAESTAALLSSEFPTAAYHAGLETGRRHRVQSEFQSGKLEVIVATIAFGMGIDKADVRSVVHMALPGSIEAYYQEMGRAGRDGRPSRAILMHSYADRHTHDFFFERDYPDVAVLDRIYKKLNENPKAAEELGKGDEFSIALEKLWTHGGAIVDAYENVSRGSDLWRDSYIAQGEQKQAQIEEVIRYSQSSECRMASLVRHFGDTKDSKKPCGICDFCAPDACVAQRFRAPNAGEREVAQKIIKSLKESSRSVGKLHGELATGGMSRDEFEELLGAMARAGFVKLTEAEFEKDGKRIPFRKANLTQDGHAMQPGEPLPLTLRAAVHRSTTKKKAKKTETKSRRPQKQENPKLEKMLRDWRLALAKKQNVPAFRIMTDKVLHGIVDEQPSTAAELLAIHGIGLKAVEKYGSQIYQIVARSRGD